MSDHMENNEQHNEIMFKLGSIEGRLDGIIDRLNIVNGRLGSHANKINDLEDFNLVMKTRINIISGIVVGVVSIISFIIGKYF